MVFYDIPVPSKDAELGGDLKHVISTSTWGHDPIELIIFFKWVEATN